MTLDEIISSLSPADRATVLAGRARTLAEAEKDFERAMAGDADADAAVGMTPNAQRGRLVQSAFAAKMNPVAFRAMLFAAWQHDHVAVSRAARQNSTLKKWFEYANQDLRHLPPELVLYRGGVCERGIEPPVSLGWGLSWTTDRDTACFFAAVYRVSESALAVRPNAFPCVVKVSVPRKYALAHIEDRNESEVVALVRRFKPYVDGMAVRAEPDTRPTDEAIHSWREAGLRYEAAKNDELQRWLS